jgi:hypothetical protein
MDERPLTCFHEIPDALEGTSSNAGNCAALGVCDAKVLRGSVALTPAMNELCRKFRRDISQLFPIFDFTQFSGLVFLRARGFGGGFTLQDHFVVSLGFVSRTRERGCELIMPRWISRLHLYVGL